MANVYYNVKKDRKGFIMGKFIIKKTKADKFMFNLKAANGAIIATSQGYADLESCKKGVESVKGVALSAGLEDQTLRHHVKQKNPKFELYKDSADQFRFRLLDKKGDNLLSSEGYTAKSSCKNGIESIRKNAPVSRVFENL